MMEILLAIGISLGVAGVGWVICKVVVEWHERR